MNTAHALKRFLVTYCVSLLSIGILIAAVVSALVPYFQQQSSATCGCDQFAVHPNTPASWFLLSLLLISIVVVFVVVTRVVRMLWHTTQLRCLLDGQVIQTTLYQTIPIHTVELDEPSAVCVGYLHPQVYITTGLVRQLSGFEVLAVIQHEVQHAKRLDPLQRLILQALPGEMLKRYTAAQEIIADEGVTDTHAIRSAFVKIADQLHSTGPRLAATWFSTNQARVNHWLGEPVVLPQWRLGLIIIIVFAILLIAGYQAFAAEPTTQAFGQCLSEKTMCESVMSYVVQ